MRVVWKFILHGQWGTVCDDLWGHKTSHCLYAVNWDSWMPHQQKNSNSVLVGVEGPIHLNNLKLSLGMRGTLIDCSVKDSQTQVIVVMQMMLV